MLHSFTFIFYPRNFYYSKHYTIRNKLLLICFLLLGLLPTWAETDFRKYRAAHLSSLPVSQDNIVFIGNSITQGNNWGEFFNNSKVISRGISGARSNEVLSHIDAYIGAGPQKVFLLIGINDLGDNVSPAQVATNIRKICERIKAKRQDTQIFLQSVFPLHKTHGRADALNQQVIALNQLIKSYATESGHTYVDIWSELKGNDGYLKANYSNDGIHLMGEGYGKWCSIVSPYVGGSAQDYNNYTNKTISPAHINYVNQRASLFARFATTAESVLMLGGIDFNTAEWSELLGTAHAKGRGIGVGYGNTNLRIPEATAMVGQLTAAGSPAPAKIFINLGEEEMGGDARKTVEQALNEYTTLVNKLKATYPGTQLYAVSVFPKGNKTRNTSQIKPFNERLQALAQQTEGLTYVDAYTALAENDQQRSSYYNAQGWLTPVGFAKVAQLFAEHLPQAKPVNEARINLNTAVITAESSLNSLTQPDRYPAETLQALRNALTEAHAQLSADTELTLEKAETLKQQLETTLNALRTSLKAPEASTASSPKWYTFRSALRGDRFMTNPANSNELQGATLAQNHKSWWRIEKRDDGSYNIVNHSGKYLNPVAAFNKAINVTESTPSQG